jgi:hypothetical protein
LRLVECNPMYELPRLATSGRRGNSARRNGVQDNCGHALAPVAAVRTTRRGEIDCRLKGTSARTPSLLLTAWKFLRGPDLHFNAIRRLGWCWSHELNGFIFIVRAGVDLHQTLAKS